MNEDYPSATNEYSATLQNQCALVKFTYTAGTTEDVKVYSGMKNVATVNFAEPGITPAESDAAVPITLYSKSETVKYAILFPQDESAEADVIIGESSFNASVPVLGLSQYVGLNDGAHDGLTGYTTLGETTVSNWAVAQKSDYVAIFTNLGSTTGDSDGHTYDSNVNDYITTGVGGTAMYGEYFSATGYGGGFVWRITGSNWGLTDPSFTRNVRPVLAF